MRYAPLLLLLASLSFSAEPEGELAARIGLLPITPRSCYCGVRGFVELRNETNHELAVKAQVELPSGWRTKPANLSLSLPAGAVSVTEFHAWTSDPELRAARTLTAGLAIESGGSHSHVASNALLLRTVICGVGELLCH